MLVANSVDAEVEDSNRAKVTYGRLKVQNPQGREQSKRLLMVGMLSSVSWAEV